MPKITNFIYGAIIISLCSALMVSFLGGLATGGGKQDFDNTTLANYNKLNELTAQTQDVKDQVTAIEQPESILDVIGGFFSSAYKAVLTTKASVDTVDSMVDTATEDAGLGQAGQLLKIAIISIIIIAIFIGVLIRIITKEDV